MGNRTAQYATVNSGFENGVCVHITETCVCKTEGFGYRIHTRYTTMKYPVSYIIIILQLNCYFFPEDEIPPLALPLPPTTSVLLIVFAAFLTDDLKLPILYDTDRE